MFLPAPKCSNVVIVPISRGILPVKQLPHSSSSDNAGKSASSVGMVPVSELLHRRSTSNVVIFPNSVGMVLVKLLLSANTLKY